MGTLKDQPPRKYQSLISTEPDIAISQIKDFIVKHKITFEQAIMFFQLLENSRKNTIYVDNGNIFDEQMSGFGKILEKLKIQIEKSPKNHHLNEN